MTSPDSVVPPVSTVPSDDGHDPVAAAAKRAAAAAPPMSERLQRQVAELLRQPNQQKEAS